MGEHACPYYLRLLVRDQPGVIADVAAALRDEKISMESMIQRGRAEGEGEAVPVIMTTHETPEAQIQRAVARSARLAAVVEPQRLLRSVDPETPADSGPDAASHAAPQHDLPPHGPHTTPGAG